MKWAIRPIGTIEQKLHAISIIEREIKKKQKNDNHVLKIWFWDACHVWLALTPSQFDRYQANSQAGRQAGRETNQSAKDAIIIISSEHLTRLRISLKKNKTTKNISSLCGCFFHSFSFHCRHWIIFFLYKLHSAGVKMINVCALFWSSFYFHLFILQSVFFVFGSYFCFFPRFVMGKLRILCSCSLSLSPSVWVYVSFFLHILFLFLSCVCFIRTVLLHYPF